MLASVPRAALSGGPRQRGDLGTFCQLAETYCLVGDCDGAAQLLPRLEPFAELNAVGPVCEYRGAVAHYLGLLSALLGRSSDALKHFDRAEALNRKLQMPLQLARTQAERARARIAVIASGRIRNGRLLGSRTRRKGRWHRRAADTGTALVGWPAEAKS